MKMLLLITIKVSVLKIIDEINYLLTYPLLNVI